MANYLLPNQPALFDFESEAQQSPLLHNIGTKSCGERGFFKWKASAIILKYVFNVIDLSYLLSFQPAPFESEAQQHLLTSSPPPILRPSSTSPALVFKISITITIIFITIIFTRPKPAYGRQGLDWIVGPGYSFAVFSTNKTMETNQKP